VEYPVEKSTDVSKEHIASVFSVEESAEQETSVKAIGKILKMEAIYSSELFVHVQRDTQHFMPEDRTVNKYNNGLLQGYICRPTASKVISQAYFLCFQNEESKLKSTIFWNVTPRSLVEFIEDQCEINLL
jgi:hypothetical protein